MTKLIYASRWDLFHLSRRLPRLFLAEVRYLMTGIESYPPVQDSHLPYNVASYPEKPTLVKPCDQITTSVRSTYQPLPLSELDSAVLWRVYGDGYIKPCTGSTTSVNPVYNGVE